MNNHFIMPEEYRRNSQLSIAPHYGRIKINGSEYAIVNKEGKDIFQCTVEAEKAGIVYVIELGDSCDLVRTDFIPLYKKLGRDTFIRLLKANAAKGDEAIRKIMNEYSEQQDEHLQ